MNRIRSQVAIGLAATLGWPLAMSRHVTSDFYVALAVLATALLVATSVVYRDRLAVWFAITPWTVAAGLGAGIAQALLTHGAYRIMVPTFPVLRQEVIELYGLMGTGMGPIRAVPIIILAIVVEELVWRGVLLEASGPTRASLLGRAAVSTVLYTIAQVGSGSWALMATAFVCGWVWWAVRHFGRSMTTAVLMHLVWSLIVLVFVPLEP